MAKGKGTNYTPVSRPGAAPKPTSASILAKQPVTDQSSRMGREIGESTRVHQSEPGPLKNVTGK